mmetsp:Transcript_59032/g.149540  ORF Transcript_59032/g.149540 Transcript_59032/m.149540 type:complete len:203 (+) Transcript_59032:3378-3986(+)
MFGTQAIASPASSRCSSTGLSHPPSWSTRTGCSPSSPPVSRLPTSTSQRRISLQTPIRSTSTRAGVISAASSTAHAPCCPTAAEPRSSALSYLVSPSSAMARATTRTTPFPSCAAASASASTPTRAPTSSRCFSYPASWGSSAHTPGARARRSASSGCRSISPATSAQSATSLPDPRSLSERSVSGVSQFLAAGCIMATRTS